ncbi:uncharacterized protein RHO17_007401 [Thomomys bottae]
MEIWDSLNRRYLDFIKKRGAGREESWLFRGLREPDRGRAEELARRTLGPGSDFLPKKGKAGKKCEAAAGWRAARAPSCAGNRGRHRSRCYRSREPGAPPRQTPGAPPTAPPGRPERPFAGRPCARGRGPQPCTPPSPRHPRTPGLRRSRTFSSQ